jgi:aspartate aminotransferase
MNQFISTYGKNVIPSKTLELSAKARELSDKGYDIISLGAGEPDFNTPDNIKLAGIEGIINNVTRYDNASGMIELRKAISEKLLKQNNLTYSTQEIIVNSGAKHSLFLALSAIINPGDEVLIPKPFWVSYTEMIKLLGGIPVIMDTEETSDFKLSGRLLEQYISKKTKAVLFNSPVNPTGAIYNRSELQEIADIVVENELLIISDEVYEEMVYDGAEHISIASLNDEIKNLTILVNSLSKTYAMTGWRVGYTAANQQIIKVMGDIQGQAYSHPCTVAQYAGITAMKSDRKIIKKMISEYAERREYIINYLNNELPDLKYIFPESAFYFFIKISSLYGNKLKVYSAMELSAALLEKQYLVVVPGEAFGVEDYIRISYATSLKNIEEGLKRLKVFINGGKQ